MDFRYILVLVFFLQLETNGSSLLNLCKKSKDKNCPMSYAEFVRVKEKIKDELLRQPLDNKQIKNLMKGKKIQFEYSISHHELLERNDYFRITFARTSGLLPTTRYPIKHKTPRMIFYEFPDDNLFTHHNQENASFSFDFTNSGNGFTIKEGKPHMSLYSFPFDTVKFETGDINFSHSVSRSIIDTLQLVSN
jgi:hypothetical protein